MVAKGEIGAGHQVFVVAASHAADDWLIIRGKGNTNAIVTALTLRRGPFENKLNMGPIEPALLLER